MRKSWSHCKRGPFHTVELENLNISSKKGTYFTAKCTVCSAVFNLYIKRTRSGSEQDVVQKAKALTQKALDRIEEVFPTS